MAAVRRVHDSEKLTAAGLTAGKDDELQLWLASSIICLVALQSWNLRVQIFFGERKLEARHEKHWHIFLHQSDLRGDNVIGIQSFWPGSVQGSRILEKDCRWQLDAAIPNPPPQFGERRGLHALMLADEAAQENFFIFLTTFDEIDSLIIDAEADEEHLPVHAKKISGNSNERIA